MGRDWRVDTLRGYFLFLMTVAHLPEHVLMRYSEYSFGYASAPDGFVFLSGITSAWVYLRVRSKYGPAAMRGKAWYRTRQIYVTHILLLSLAILAGLALHGTSFRATHPLLALGSGSIFLYQPQMSDILPMYCLFFLFLPLTLEQMARGRAWLVGLISAALWLAAQRGIGDSVPAVSWIDLGAFNVLCWQAYFVAGQYIGYRKTVGKPAAPKTRLLLGACAALAFFLFIERHLPIVRAHWLHFHRGPDHNPLRFLDAACLAYLVWRVPRTLDELLKRFRLVQMFNFLGQHSLQVFAWSIALTCTLYRFRGHYWYALNSAGQVCLALLAGFSCVIPAYLHQMYRERRSPKMASLVKTPVLAGD